MSESFKKVNLQWTRISRMNFWNFSARAPRVVCRDKYFSGGPLWRKQKFLGMPRSNVDLKYFDSCTIKKILNKPWCLEQTRTETRISESVYLSDSFQKEKLQWTLVSTMHFWNFNAITLQVASWTGHPWIS